MDKILKHLWLAILTSTLLIVTLATADEKSLIIAVVPQFSSIQTNRDWAPLLSRLEQATGYHFQLRVYEQISIFEADVSQGIPDLAFMNPYQLLIARQARGYRPLVRDSSANLEGILVVRRDSPIKTLGDLNGKTIAFPSPNALGASLYLRALLAEKEGIKINPVYIGSHQTVYRQVLQGSVQAGGGVRATLSKEPEAIQAQLRTLYTTPDLAPHPLAAHPRVPAGTSKKIVAALLAIRNDPESSKLLAAVQLTQPIEADFQRDYEPLSRLKLERYADTTGK